jgi:hydroxypyruvate isomerase
MPKRLWSLEEVALGMWNVYVGTLPQLPVGLSAATGAEGGGAMTHTLRYLPNCSLLFREVPLLERPAAAKAAGFDAIEMWWPFNDAAPTDTEVAAFVAAIKGADVDLVGLNFFAGDLFGPDAGVLSIPARAHEFADSVSVAVRIGEALGVRAFNALYGNRVDDSAPPEQDALAIEQIVAAADAVGSGATVLIEPVSGPKPYPLRTAADAVAVIDHARAAGANNVGLLFDVYHLAANGVDLDAAIAAYADRVSHVQIADFPGRHEPGTADLDLDRYLCALQAAGYEGWVSLEYNPATTTEESLAWLPRARRAGR